MYLYIYNMSKLKSEKIHGLVLRVRKRAFDFLFNLSVN
jgi:hypothetical protein